MSKLRQAGKRRTVALPAATNQRNRMNGVDLLTQTPDAVAAMVFFDPQHRNVLEKLAFGNEGARQRGRARLPQMSTETITYFVEEIARVLRPSGHLMLWIDKYCLASADWRRWLRHAPELQTVDLLSWNKMTIGMGRRLRCATEYLVILQKAPTRAKGVWTDHGIRDGWTEQVDQFVHPHAKPYQLTERLIRAATKRGDIVIDPCAGSYIVLDACRAARRVFLGCDIMSDGEG